MNFPSFLPMDFKTIMFVLKNLNDSTCPLTKRVKKQSLSYIDRLWKMLKKKIKLFFLIFKDCYHSRRVKQNSKTRLKKVLHFDGTSHFVNYAISVYYYLCPL